MKSRIPIHRDVAKRATEIARAEFDKYASLHTDVVLKLVASQLNELYGFGRIRTLTLINGIMKELQAIGDTYGTDCTLVKLNRDLERINVVNEAGEWTFDKV